MAETAEGKKVDQEDLNSIEELKQEFGAITAQTGQVDIEIFLIERRLEQLTTARDELLQKYLDAEKKEAELVENLNKKYGEGYIDTITNTFIPESQ